MARVDVEKTPEKQQQHITDKCVMERVDVEKAPETQQAAYHW